MKDLFESYKAKRKLKIIARQYLTEQLRFHSKVNNSALVQVAAELLRKN